MEMEYTVKKDRLYQHTATAMEEIVFYSSEGQEGDKSGALSLGVATSVHSQSQTLALRQVASHPNGAAITGTKPGDRVFVAAKGKALVSVYTWGKESPDQRIPIPEQLACVALCPNVIDSTELHVDEDEDEPERNLPKLRLPYLLIGAGISGKIYVWELNSGLLLNVKEAHYQQPNVLKVTSDGSYLISAGKDARVLIWKIADLVSFNQDDDRIVKPVHVFSDHSLEVTDIHVNNNPYPDSKLYTVSKDSTIRVYNLSTFQLLSTFVISSPIDSIVVDAADRALFVGLSTGNIRQINLYEPNPATNILEAKGGAGKIVTLSEDLELKHTITYHTGSPVTKITLSLDGASLISGDAQGKVVISDIVSRQVIKEFKELGSKITNLQVLSTFQTSDDSNIEKTNRPIPQFKRDLTNKNPKDQDVLFQIGQPVEEKLFDIDELLDRVSKEALFFQNLSSIKSEVVIRDDDGLKDQKIKELEAKVEKTTKAYTDLRGMYEELYTEHTKSLK